ncbi:MAG: NAD(P)-dependent oxidoreductase [Rhodospirillaceae bacterium]|jgi:3-hydroxyisobutyrate dehydrogenase-like beta-hydroxyacid dehydrogenase|nr:NAD(P)-dependent oxidoreductase [Rhodospirillaceae bacterium]MBT5459476.1 NAD(P)-dependent oxidoreductase [Rhodospirillaceae bacterium]MBT5810203.1 NAD(P)-dependent oxidoreductase [Rhodospirillaceae bacterium]
MSENGAVGFIGLGAMGYGMARNLVEKGHDVLAYDLQSQPLQRLVQQGGREAGSVAEIGRSCRQVMVMVVDGAQVESVVCGPGGLLETMTDGVILINSTIALSELRRIAAVVETSNVTLIDCPVSGGITGADEGTLTMLCGGDVDAFEAQRPLLDAVSANVTHLGPLGAGMVGKLANNLILGVGRLAIAEAFSMAQKAGLSTEALYKTMITCTADSKQLRGLEGAIVRGEYPSRTFLGLKDLSAAVDSGAAVGQAMPVTGLARELYQLIEDKSGGLGGSDEVLRYLLDN